MDKLKFLFLSNKLSPNDANYSCIVTSVKLVAVAEELESIVSFQIPVRELSIMAHKIVKI